MMERENAMNYQMNRWGGPAGPRRMVVKAPAAPGTRLNSLDRLKERLLAKHLAQATGPEQAAAVRWAARDAVALAWATSHPLLVLPVLLEEKAAVALNRARRQKHLRERERAGAWRLSRA